MIVNKTAKSTISPFQFLEIPQKKDSNFISKIFQCFGIEERLSKNNLSEKTKIAYVSIQASSAREKIVKLLGSENGKIISNDAFENLKKIFSYHSNGSAWLAELKQAVAERKQEIKEKGIFHRMCHAVIVWRGQSITAQAELLIFQMTKENPSLIKIPNLSLSKQVNMTFKEQENDSEAKIEVHTEANQIKTELFLEYNKNEKSDHSLQLNTFQHNNKKVENLLNFAKAAKGEAKGDRNLVGETKSVIMLDQGKYQGELKNNLPHGLGRLEHLNGNIFEGKFKNGNFIKGRQITSCGVSYEGEFRDDLLEGPGILTSAQGTVKTAQFIRGNLDFTTLLTLK